MAIFNTADTTYAVIAETVPGTVPATPVFANIPYIPGTMPNYDGTALMSDVRYPNRGVVDMRKVDFKVTGGNKVHFKRDTAVELLLQSALSGVWATNVLTAGKTETSLTIEQCQTDGTNKLYSRYSGIEVSEFSIDADFNGNIEADFTYVGMTKATATAIVTGATYTGPNIVAPLLTGLDISGLTIAGITSPIATKLSLKVTNDRETQGTFGSAGAVGVGTTSRKITGSITLYRKDFSLETVLIPGGVPANIAMSFNIGSGTGNGYTFSIPCANFEQPQDAEDGSKVLVTVAFTATVDPTLLTDLRITRL